MSDIDFTAMAETIKTMRELAMALDISIITAKQPPRNGRCETRRDETNGIIFIDYNGLLPSKSKPRPAPVCLGD